MEMARLNRICATMLAGQQNEFQESGMRIDVQEVKTRGIMER